MGSYKTFIIRQRKSAQEQVKKKETLKEKGVGEELNGPSNRLKPNGATEQCGVKKMNNIIEM